MMNKIKQVGFISVLLLSASAMASKDVDIKTIDIHHIITHEAQSQNLAVSKAEGVSWLSELLVDDYGYAAISDETDVTLRELYSDTAWLLRNGKPIAGGVLVTIARNNVNFNGSRVGEGMVQFVDAMLLPSHEDSEDDTVEIQGYLDKSERAVSLLRVLSGPKAMAAQLYVVGDIYNDTVAVAAGKTALMGLEATKDEWGMIESVRLYNKGAANDQDK